MRLLIKKLTTSNFGIFIRNLTNFNPIHMSIKGLECATVSDAFAWRTDNNFVTKFSLL